MIGHALLPCFICGLLLGATFHSADGMALWWYPFASMYLEDLIINTPLAAMVSFCVSIILFFS